MITQPKVRGAKSLVRNLLLLAEAQRMCDKHGRSDSADRLDIDYFYRRLGIIK